MDKGEDDMAKTGGRMITGRRDRIGRTGLKDKSEQLLLGKTKRGKQNTRERERERERDTHTHTHTHARTHSF